MKISRSINYSILFLSLFFLLGAGRVSKADRGTMDNSVFSRVKMELLGSALKKFLTFRVVSVDLYIAQNDKAQDVLSDIAKRLEVTYHVSIPKHELDRATTKGIDKNVTQKELQRLMPQIDQINSYYQDVKSGDKIAITYVPKKGSQVKFNGKVKGIIKGEEFAKAFFSIWVGENPVDKRAKRQLLGGKGRKK